jgi:hypothetical protein
MTRTCQHCGIKLHLWPGVGHFHNGRSDCNQAVPVGPQLRDLKTGRLLIDLGKRVAS